MVEIRFPNSGLSADYGDVIIGEITQTVSVEITTPNGSFIETYTPNSENRIYIPQLGKLAMLYYQEYPVGFNNFLDGSSVSLLIEISIGASLQLVKFVEFFKCDSETLGTITPDILKKMPLSRITNKTTSIGRSEFVSFYNKGGKVYVEVAYITNIKDQAKTIEINHLNIPLVSYFSRINVSPAVIAGLAGVAESDLIYYFVYKEKNYSIRFDMDERHFPQKQTFIFRNTFGAQETFTCTGDEEQDRSWERNFGSINGYQKLITNSLENKHTVNTGYITPEMAGLLEDMLNSQSVYILENDTRLVPVCFTGENFVITSRRDELIAVELEYRYSSDNQKQLRYIPHQKPGIFDDTFDQTFN